MRRSYGSPRVYSELRKNGVSCSRRRIANIMRAYGIKSTSVGLYKRSIGHHETYGKHPNLLKEAQPTKKKNQHWAGDFTYLKTKQGFMFLAIVIDLYTRKIVGYSLSKLHNSKLTVDAMKRATKKQWPEKPEFFHSDQGIEYNSVKFQEQLNVNGIKCSMSRKASPLDNAFSESFFHTLKTECVYPKGLVDKDMMIYNIREYIKYYNTKRIHSSLDGMTPLEFENN